MTRNLQRNRQGVATCQQRLFRNQMEKLFLSLSPSISLWPRYFCSLKSLAKLGPCYSCTSKLTKSQTKSLKKNIQYWGFLPYISLCWSLVSHSCVRYCFVLSRFFFCCPTFFVVSLHFLPPPHSCPLFTVRFLRSLCYTSPYPFIHLPPFQPLIFSPPAH